MRSLWPLIALILFESQPARGSPLPSIPSTALNLSSNISVAQDLGGITLKSTDAESQNFLPVNNFTNTFNTSGPVTVFKTIQLIPRPVPSHRIPQANIFLHHANNLVPPIRASATEIPQTITPSLSPLAKSRSFAIPSVSSSSLRVMAPQPFSTTSVSISLQVAARQSSTTSVPTSLQVTAFQTLPASSVSSSLGETALQSTDQLVKAPELQPIVVGGLTYTPVYVHDGPSSVSLGQGGLQASQTSLGVDKVHGSNSYDLDRENLPSEQARASLPPVVVGGLTYGFEDKALESEPQTPAPMVVASSTSKTGKAVVVGVGTTSSSPRANSIAAEPPLAVSSEPSVVIRTQSSNAISLSLAPASLLINVSTFTFHAPPPTTASTITSTYASLTLPPSVAKTGFSLAPASPQIITLANQTFTAYPLGLSIAGTEVFQGSSAITISGTAISLGSSEVVVGASTIAVASVPGLGAALSAGSGTEVTQSASGMTSGTEPHATSTGPNNARPSSGTGRLDRGGRVEIVMMITLLIFIVL